MSDPFNLLRFIEAHTYKSVISLWRGTNVFITLHATR